MKNLFSKFTDFIWDALLWIFDTKFGEFLFLFSIGVIVTYGASFAAADIHKNFLYYVLSLSVIDLIAVIFWPENKKTKVEKDKSKIPWFRIIKCGWKHRFGNFISAIIHLIEELIIVITFGFIYPNFTWKWLMFRLFDPKFSKYLNDPQKEEKNENG